MTDDQAISQKVAVIDSGVGGLSVLQEIVSLLPGRSYTYFADWEYSPYGQKSPSTIIDRSEVLFRSIERKIGPNLFVLACNTATTVAISHLRSITSIPIIGVVPAIKPAAKLTAGDSIAILATPETSKGKYLDNLIAEFGLGKIVKVIPAPGLVSLAEKKLAGSRIAGDDLRWLEEHVEELQGVDTAVLGCTHFPLLKEELSQLHPQIRWVDSGKAIARRAKSLLPETELRETTLDFCYSGPEVDITPYRKYIEDEFDFFEVDFRQVDF